MSLFVLAGPPEGNGEASSGTVVIFLVGAGWRRTAGGIAGTGRAAYWVVVGSGVMAEQSADEAAEAGETVKVSKGNVLVGVSGGGRMMVVPKI